MIGAHLPVGFWSRARKDELRARWLNGEVTNDIAAIMGCSGRTIRTQVSKMDLPRRKVLLTHLTPDERLAHDRAIRTASARRMAEKRSGAPVKQYKPRPAPLPILAVAPTPKPPRIPVDELIRQHIAQHGVTHLPAVAVLPTSAVLPPDDRSVIATYHANRNAIGAHTMRAKIKADFMGRASRNAAGASA